MGISKLWRSLALLVAFTGWFGCANAVELYVDTAPNVYGSPAWAPWWSATKTDVVGGTFQNMRSGAHPDSTWMTPYEEIVYSTGDLGHRLHWIYWAPGQTVASLDGLFEVKWVIDWGGDAWTTDAGGGWVLDSPTDGWGQPGATRWEDYAGGTIGSFGFAWWSTDNDAPPLDTGGNIYDEVDQADIDALAAQVAAAQTYALGMVRYRASVNDPWTAGPTLKVNLAPEPVTLALAGAGLLVAGWSRRRR